MHLMINNKKLKHREEKGYYKCQKRISKNKEAELWN